MAEKQHTRWIWEHNLYDKTWAEVRGSSGFDPAAQEALRVGTSIAEPLPTLRIDEVTPGEHPDFLLHPAYVITSERLTRLIIDTGARVQLLPVRMKRSPARYQVVNLLEHIDAFDEAASKVRRWPDGTIRAVKKVVLRPLPAGTPRLFRVAALPWLWVADDELRCSVEDACTGAGRFLAPDKFKFG